VRGFIKGGILGRGRGIYVRGVFTHSCCEAPRYAVGFLAAANEEVS